jgi:hypothetical protein
MPSKSKKQHNLMALVANDPKAAKRLGIPKSVGEEFMSADKGKKFKGGGMAKEDTKMDMAQDKAMIKKAMKQHDEQEHKGGKGTKLALKKGGMAKDCGYKEGGRIAAKGEHPVQKQSKRGAEIMTMKKGGSCSKYVRGGGIEVRGKTKGKIC